MNETNPAGYKTSKFKEFIENPVVQELLKAYHKGTIKSLDNLRIALDQKGIKIAISTLKNYMKQIKEVPIKFYFKTIKQNLGYGRKGKAQTKN